jgi:CRISPR-associated exonuclease Cas4
MELIPLSALNHFLYCSRRAALIHIEGIFEDNHHTLEGIIAHEHAELAGYEISKGAKLLRSLPVFYKRLGLSGKCDIVEEHVDGSLYPVEYKKGKRRKFDNDDAQLCAQALCLEEMFSVRVERGAVFHAASKRRREVDFTTALRAFTETAIAELHRMIKAEVVPASVLKPQCKECSLYEICVPEVTSLPARLSRNLTALFEVKNLNAA